MDKIIGAVSELIGAISKLKISVLLIILGAFLIFGFFYEIQNLTIVKATEPNYIILLLGIAFIVLALWSESKFRDSPEKVADRATKMTGRRFANLIYVYSVESNRIALGRHEKIGFLPPGRRLGLYEPPDKELVSIVHDQFGIKVSEENFISTVITPQTTSHTDENGQTMGETQFCISPVWVQLEKHPLHRPNKKVEVGEHLDFVFLCTVEKEVSLKDGSRKDCGWFGREDLTQMIKPNEKHKTPVDVLRGFDAIQKYLGVEQNA